MKKFYLINCILQLVVVIMSIIMCIREFHWYYAVIGSYALGIYLSNIGELKK